MASRSVIEFGDTNDTNESAVGLAGRLFARHSKTKTQPYAERVQARFKSTKALNSFV